MAMEKKTRTLLFAAAGVGAVVIIAMVAKRGGLTPSYIAGGASPLPGGLQPVTLRDPARNVLTLPPQDNFADLLASLKDDCACQSCSDNSISTVTRPTIRETAYMPPQTYLNDYMLSASEREALNNGNAALVLDDYSAQGYSVQSMLAPLDYMPSYMILPAQVGGDLFDMNANENPAGDVSLMGG